MTIPRAPSWKRITGPGSLTTCWAITSSGINPGWNTQSLPEPGMFLDEWGVIWNKTVDKDLGVPANRMLPERDLAPLLVPDPHDPRRYAGLTAYFSANPHRFRLFSVSFSLFERAWTLHGMEALMTDMVEAPEFVEALLDRIFEWNMTVLNEMLKHPFDGVLFGDDWGQRRGLMFGAKRWRRFRVKTTTWRPCIARSRTPATRVCIHSCGKVQDLFPELIDIGLNVFNPFQPEVMDLREMKKPRYGDRLTFYGGVSVQPASAFRLAPAGA